MSKVRITNGIYRNECITGIFSATTTYKKSYTPGPKTGKINIIDDSGKCLGVWVNKEDVTYLDKDSTETMEEPEIKMTDLELGRIISDRFASLHDITKGVIVSSVRALIVSGAPGIGKTFLLEQQLKMAERLRQITKYSFVAGKASPVGLYQTLWEHREKKNVLVLDDIDSVFYDTNALNILKAALDTNEKRTITWATDSRVLRDAEIPTSFNFDGSVIFITNEDFDKRIAKRDKLAPHLEALVSRSIYLDLAIHSKRAIFLRIKQVIFETPMLTAKGFNDHEKVMIVLWIERNLDKLRVLSLRTALQVASLIRMQPLTWERTACVTLLKPERMF